MANEKRLIDANALRKRMFSYYSCVDENSNKEYYKGDTLMSYEVADMIEDCIDNAPTVDAVEVVHGHWISRGYKIECSVCGHRSFLGTHDPVIHTEEKSICKYCHNCGAKMDGERKDNEY